MTRQNAITRHAYLHKEDRELRVDLIKDYLLSK